MLSGRLLRATMLVAAFWILAGTLAATAASAPQARFPLHVSADRRHLEDRAGRPFLLQGEAAWSLIAELDRSEAETYLEDRRRRGFNTLLVSLIEHEFSSHSPADAAGEQPFLAPGDFSRPNERYFDNARWLLQRAAEKGFLVLLTPAYLGVNGGSQGWQQDMTRAGPEAMRTYGRYVAGRFRDLPNIVWVHGGDNDAPDRSLIEAMVAGIEEAAPGSLHTVHSGRETATADYWPDARWLALNTVYTYGDVYGAVAVQYARKPAMPVILIESLYEAEHDAGAEKVRAQAYGAMLAGAAGHVFGNNPIWHFSGPGVTASPGTWQEALASPGSQSMQHLRAFFDPLAWWSIAPDEGRVLKSGALPRGGRAIAGTASDLSFSIVYATGAPAIRIDAAALGARPLKARWYDPSNGSMGAPQPVAGGRALLHPPAARNAGGGNDWVLLLGPAS